MSQTLSRIAALQDCSGCLSRLYDHFPEQHPQQLRELTAEISRMHQEISLQPLYQTLGFSSLHPVAQVP